MSFARMEQPKLNVIVKSSRKCDCNAIKARKRIIAVSSLMRPGFEFAAAAVMHGRLFSF